MQWTQIRPVRLNPEWTLNDPPDGLNNTDDIKYRQFVRASCEQKAAVQSTLRSYQATAYESLHQLGQIG